MSTIPRRPTGKHNTASSASTGVRNQIFTSGFFPSGLSSLRKFTSPTSRHETSIETTWTVCGGSEILFCPRQVRKDIYWCHWNPSLWCSTFIVWNAPVSNWISWIFNPNSCSVEPVRGSNTLPPPVLSSHCSPVKTPSSAGSQERWRKKSTSWNQTSRMWRFWVALTTASVTFGTCASPWTSGRRWSLFIHL